MSANDLSAVEKTAANLAGLFEILGKPYDSFRPVWSDADMASRRLFMKIAKMPEEWSRREWDNLGRAEREQLKTRVIGLQVYLNKYLSKYSC